MYGAMDGARLVGCLLPMRLLTMTLHFVVVVSAFGARVDMIQVTMQEEWSDGKADRKYSDADDNIVSILSLANVCFLAQLIMFLFMGLIMNMKLCAIHSLADICGAVFLLWAQMEGWTYLSVNTFFVFFVFFPTLLDVAMVVSMSFNGLLDWPQKLSNCCRRMWPCGQ